MKGSHFLWNGNTSSLQKTELHLTNLVPCTLCYIYSSMVLTAGSMFQSYHTLVPGINLFFTETVWVPLSEKLYYNFHIGSARSEGVLCPDVMGKFIHFCDLEH